MRDIDAQPRTAEPWWRFGIVWFALAGPALVVVASFATLAIALARADRAIPEVPAATTNAGRVAPTAPALQARNHAATPRQETR